MVNFVVNMDLYFWFIDRAGLQDDPRNEMLADMGKVILHREVANKLINGVYIAKLMLNIRKIVITKSNKPFTLSSDLQKLKDQPLEGARQHNWNIISLDLRKFNIKMTKDQIKAIVADQDPDFVMTLMQLLL